ncbi:MAG: hypothetical protein NTZ92_08175 [Candidatus Omnitrophica bacterium]|nr:hypothetical protein [Candidatus Omnitrophota bacterium]
MLKRVFIGVLVISLISFPVFVEAKAKGNVEVLEADIDGDGSKEEISFIKKPIEDELDGLAEGTLQIKAKNKVFTKDLGEIENSSGASLEVIKVSSNVKPFIGIFSFAGAHGMRLMLFSFDGSKIMQEIEVFSDAPSIEFKDIDKDGIKEIVAKSRDYDNSPIKDSIVKTYKYLDKKWQLESTYKTIE